MLVAVVLALAALVAADVKYSTKYDNIDVDAILKNERLVATYIECIMGRGKCTAVGEELKKIIPDFLETNCLKCSERQKHISKKIIKYLVEKKNDWYSELVAKFDPEGKYTVKYRSQAAADGIDI